MVNPRAVSRPNYPLRTALLAGVSALALLVYSSPVEAACIGCSAQSAGSNAAAVAAASALANAQAAAAAAQRAQASMTRATQALAAMRAAQAAANALARSAPGSVPDGIVAGGLMPVANPLPAAQDATGLQTWEGASQPTQTTGANGQVGVKVHQTQTAAILSWQSFNVGSRTTLTFDQQGNANWIALNRVVGSSAPSQILGSIKADGTVLIINQSGIIFGGGAQVNVGSLIASTLDVGSATVGNSNNQPVVQTVAQRDLNFLTNGLIGNAGSSTPIFSPASNLTTTNGFLTNYQSSGSVSVQNGAEISSGPSGYILLTGPVVENAGHLSAIDGQVLLAAGDVLTAQVATGAAGSQVPGIRGLLIAPQNKVGVNSVVNDATGIIESARGSIFLGSTSATVNQGGLFATTSVSSNGAIEISGTNIELAPGSIIAITPDAGGGTIPQDPTSLAAFKPSEITIGNLNSRLTNTAADTSALIDIETNTLTYAPSGNITIGVQSGPIGNTGQASNSRIFVDSGAVIDASGLKDVVIPASRNALAISPLTANDLADDPLNALTLKDATVYVDPRLSGVRADGVAWVGSPLIDAGGYAQQVGVSVAELMTKGGNVTIGVDSFAGNGAAATTAPNIIIKSGASIDISGGWVTYQAGQVASSLLIDSFGRITNIGKADPNTVYVGVLNGFTVDHSHWGITDTYASGLIGGSHYEPQYTEGRDAGTLAIVGSAAAIDGTVYAQAFPGTRQLADSQVGTGTSSVYGDERPVQAAPSQLPAGGFLFVQAEANTALGSNVGGGNILIQSASDYQALPATVGYGQSLVVTNGTVTVPARDPSSFLTPSQLGTIDLSDALLSNSGLGQVSLATTGTVTVAANATVTLTPGGVFNVLAGHRITVDGTVSASGGQISLVTFDGRGSVFSTAAPTVGDYDVVVDGTLSTRGRWVNDSNLASDDIAGSAWLNGGSITLYAAPRISPTSSVASGAVPATTTDLSGSIYINTGSVVDVSGGGRVDQKGKLNLTAHGGNLSIYDDTSYFEIAGPGPDGDAGTLDGLRVTGLFYPGNSGPTVYVPVNPAQINAKVLIDSNAIKAQGFGGGGTFTLSTPEFAFSDDTSSTASANATRLPLSFFSTAGFASYKITSYKTALFANPFTNPTNPLGGNDAVLATQTLTIGAGQNLNLTQAMLPSILNAEQTSALLDLATGGDVFSAVSPAVPANAWDRKAASLTLGGLLELNVAPGGSITGDAGAALTISKLYNQGTIRLPGGLITQQEVLPLLYTQAGVEAIHSLSDIFTVNPDGTITESAASKIAGLTNGQLAGATQTNAAGQPTGSTNVESNPIYFLGLLAANQGIVLAPGSVTDLSGTSIRDPYATAGRSSIVTGRIVDGGSITTLPSAALNGQSLFQPQFNSVYENLTTIATGTDLSILQVGGDFVLQPGSTLNLSGASDTYQLSTLPPGLRLGPAYPSMAVWSNAGTLSAGANLTTTGATILAQGGAPQALGGTLAALDPVLAQHDPATPTANILSADMISAAGFDTLVAYGSVSNSGNVTLDLGRGFFLETRPLINNGVTLSSGSSAAGNNFVPTVRSGGGTLEIDAPYIGFDSNFDTISTSAIGTSGSGNVIFKANNIDFTGAVLIDSSVANATFQASSDIRLTGVVPWQQLYYPGGTAAANTATTLNGQIAANGNLNFIAGQLYPTTGSTFTITSSAANGTIAFGSSGVTSTAPYSAGGNLTVLAANIVQGGVIRVPLGTLTLGGAALTGFAPATQNVTLTAGSVTSVSANGLVIPYGTTTDQTEWYFAPLGINALTAPPAKLLSLNGANVAVNAGATIDLSGGGDISAYEFVPGTGGSRDVLNRLNPDSFTGNNGLQYPDGRQVYAIVPGLSNNALAPYDPIYSAGYNLSSVTGVGSRVWLDAAPGLAAGWYTLLPAQYAMLPGGMRVVEQTGATNIGVSGTLADGTIVTTGRYGDALSGASQSQLRVFDVQSQAVINRESDIALTTGNSYFAALAVHNGNTAPRLPLDAGRMVLNPTTTLALDSAATFLTSAPAGGLGAQVDISGANIDILASLAGAPADGAIHLTASSLTNLHADSLLVGGTRTDNADGTTSLNVTAQNLLVQNNSTTPLSAGEIVLAASSSLTVADGSVIAATGTLSDERSGAYEIGSSSVVGSGTGALIRVADGPQRLVVRTNGANTASLHAGAATFNGNAVMFDSSGANTLSAGLIIENAKFVALGAPRIGIGVDPSTYTGLAVTDALESLLTQSGAQLTLRSQSTIDFADGAYDFGTINFDAAALDGLDGGAVTVNADTISLGNAGAAGVVCATCNTNNGTLAINARQIIFTGGSIATKAAVLASSVSVTLSSDTTVMLPVGTLVSSSSASGALTVPAAVVLPAGTVVSFASGTGVLLPASASGTLAAGTTVGLTPTTITLPANSSYYFPNGFITGGAPNSVGVISQVKAATVVSIPAGAPGVLGTDTAISVTPFFGGGVTLSAQEGVFAQGANSVFDTGPATLAVHTPYLGDRATPAVAGVTPTIPALTLASDNAVTIDTAGVGAAGVIDGVPGASIAINGQSVAISGTTVNATAGTLRITSVTGITLDGGALIEAPGYVKMFGDAADPMAQSAPGGQVLVVANNGNIALGNVMLSVGGGSGDAGTLSLSAPRGAVTGLTGATLNGTGGAGGAGGAFSLDALGAVDLAALNTLVGSEGFTGSFSIHTSTGDLDLAAGQTLVSGAVNLTADGGVVDIAGTIDVSGINGGQVNLYGTQGVTLESSAQILARASGYGRFDTRQARGGDVTLGTDLSSTSTNQEDGSVSGTSGQIRIAAGAVIDVSALNTQPRIVEGQENGLTTFNYVAGDQGGTVTLRAPVQYVAAPDGSKNPDGTPKMVENVSVSVASASSVVGASSVILEAFQRWDLLAVAKGKTGGVNTFTGVTYDGNSTVTLDVTAGLDTPTANGTMTTVAGLNFLGDRTINPITGLPTTDVGATGSTVVDYIQNFGLSAATDSNLGGLASQANFHARPGIDLSYDGNITLASNWNLGAGVVNVTGATTANLMTTSAATGLPVVVAGDEAAILANYTTMIYRVGGKAFGEPGDLSIRATGNLNIGQPNKTGSITDGFFTFGDQTDPNYLANALSSGPTVVQLPTSCTGACSSIADFVDGSTALPSARLNVSFAGTIVSAGASLANPVPYDAAANTPAALGSGTNGVGDPIGSAEVFPLIQGPNGQQPVTSWSYQLTAGAQANSANPARVQPNANGSVIVQGNGSYSYGVTSVLLNNLDLTISGKLTDLSNYVSAEESIASNIDLKSAVAITMSAAPSAIRTTLEQAAANYFAALPLDPQGKKQYIATGLATAPVMITTTLGNALAFMQSLNWSSYNTAYVTSSSTGATATATTQTLIRSGTGSINLAAAGNIDLRNGATPTLVGNYQRGGVPIYTAGVPVTPGLVTAIDTTTGQAVTLDPSAYGASSNYIGTLNDQTAGTFKYGYGLASSNVSGFYTGVAGVLVSNTLYLDNGGNITLTAGGDVLGRRDAYDEDRFTISANNPLAPFIGFGDQPWRTGLVGAPDSNDAVAAQTNILVDPQMFFEGLGALGGGNVTVRAGGSVSDLTVVSDTSITTGAATGAVLAGQTNVGLITFGGGNVTVAAASDVLGSRVDVASGTGNISAGGSIRTAGLVRTAVLDPGSHFISNALPIDDTLRLRLADATVSVTSHGDATLDGIRALAVQNIDNGTGQIAGTTNGYAATFYSANAGASIVADGSITLSQNGDVIPFGGVAYGSDLNIGRLAVLPGSLTAVGLLGDLTLTPNPTGIAVLLNPSPAGELILAAGMDINGATVAMLDSQPGPTIDVPSVLPTTSVIQLRQLHNPSIPHQDDPVPDRIYAGEDIDNLNLTVPKQTRIGAGRDIVNMMFFGENLNPTDITRIVAGRDITATTVLTPPSLSVVKGNIVIGTQEPAVQGNTFVIGGPGSFMLEAGRDIGPFLNSATVNFIIGNNTDVPYSTLTASFGGGILAVGNAWNPWLPAKSAEISVMFGVADGINYDGFRDHYLDPANVANLPSYLLMPSAGGTESIYGPELIQWMNDTYGTSFTDYTKAYAAFKALPELSQRIFLNKVYFNELEQTADKGSVTYLQYARGYEAVNVLFPASYGYTANDLSGGSNGANATVVTGNLDLRLATIQTEYGGDIDIMGPGGRVIAGSTVRTDAQAARRTYDGGRLFAGNIANPSQPKAAKITSIPPGYEGVLTMRGGNINTFTDGDFLLNQSRLFTEGGGNILMWSSNADLNAGQGPKTSANFPPVVVTVDPDIFVQQDRAGATTGAGIAALQATPDAPPSDVTLIAPRGTVDAGAAGVRVSGNFSVAALQVLNTANIQVQGTTTGIPTVQGPPVAALTSANNTAGAAQTAVAAPAAGKNDQPSVIIVEFMGFGGGDDDLDEKKKRDGRQQGDDRQGFHEMGSRYQVVGAGELTGEEIKQLTEQKRQEVGR